MLTHNEHALLGFTNAQWSLMLWCLATDTHITPDVLWNDHLDCINTKLDYKMIFSRKFWMYKSCKSLLCREKCRTLRGVSLSLFVSMYLFLSLTDLCTCEHIHSYISSRKLKKWWNNKSLFGKHTLLWHQCFSDSWCFSWW